MWPFTTTQISTARITTSTMAPVTRGIGWSKGIADQLSLPSIAGLRIGGFLRSRSRRNLLGRDIVEQQGLVEPPGRLVLRHRLFQQLLLVDVGIQHIVAAHGLGRKAVKIGLRDDMDIEQHVRETV